MWRYPRKWGLRSSAVKVNKVPPIGPGKAEMADGARHILSGGSQKRTILAPRSNPRSQLSVCQGHPLAPSAHSAILVIRDKPDG